MTVLEILIISYGQMNCVIMVMNDCKSFHVDACTCMVMYNSSMACIACF